MRRSRQGDLDPFANVYQITDEQLKVLIAAGSSEMKRKKRPKKSPKKTKE